MADHMTISKILGEIEQLSYSDRMKLVESIVRSLRLREEHPSHGGTPDSPEELFGIWRDRSVTLAEIREKAWRQP
jgi:hypothetical protein